jgi:hypothetical protein
MASAFTTTPGLLHGTEAIEFSILLREVSFLSVMFCARLLFPGDRVCPSGSSGVFCEGECVEAVRAARGICCRIVDLSWHRLTEACPNPDIADFSIGPVGFELVERSRGQLYELSNLLARPRQVSPGRVRYNRNLPRHAG